MITPKNEQTEHTRGEPSQKTNQSDSEVPFAPTPQTQFQPPKAHCEITCKVEHNWWDKAKPWVEMFGAVVLTVYTYYTAKMYCANRGAAVAATSAAKTAASQLELAERPWVDANIELDGDVPLDFNVNGLNVHLKISLRNTGHSPAQHTAISFAFLAGYEGVNAVSYRPKVCEDAGRISTTMPQFGLTLFPSVNFEQQESVGIGKEDLEKSKMSRLFPGSHFRDDTVGTPAIIICIAYQPTFKSNSVYHTAYIADLYTLDDANRMGVLFKIGENKDAKHVVMRRHIEEAISAD
jgi:hypothetical protein